MGLEVSRHSPLTAAQCDGGHTRLIVSRLGVQRRCCGIRPAAADGTQPACMQQRHHHHKGLCTGGAPSSASSSLSSTLRAGLFCSRAAMMRCRAAASTSLRFASSPLLPAAGGRTRECRMHQKLAGEGGTCQSGLPPRCCCLQLGAQRRASLSSSALCCPQLFRCQPNAAGSLGAT